MKPYKGEIHNWRRIPIPSFWEQKGLGYVIFGKPVGHPSFINWIRTSEVIKVHVNLRNESCIETENSKYLLMGEEQCGNSQ